MKKVKIMLLIIGATTITAGILAFKVLTPQQYCKANPVTTAPGGPLLCPTTLLCDLAATTDVFTTTDATVDFLCIQTGDGDKNPCVDGLGNRRKCNTKATTTTE